jgi:tRNA threonylcarbamoyladenosine biosynthesis protein TsaE
VHVYICKMEIVYHLRDINKAATSFRHVLNNKQVIAFSGEMGSGKTTFIHALCVTMGVTDTVSSPTFSIINEYDSDDGNIYHIDLYRCKNEEEAIRAGVEDCIYSGNYCFIEWPSKAEGIFPPDTLRVEIIAIDENTRKIEMKESAGNQ